MKTQLLSILAGATLSLPLFVQAECTQIAMASIDSPAVVRCIETGVYPEHSDGPVLVRQAVEDSAQSFLDKNCKVLGNNDHARFSTFCADPAGNGGLPCLQFTSTEYLTCTFNP